MVLFAVLPLFLGLVGAASWPMTGLDAYRNYDMYDFRTGEETHEFSSYDRKNHNDDGFAGTYSCLSNDADGRCVIADFQGVGEVASIWFTYDPDSIVKAGDIKVTLDGKDVLTGSIQDIVNSALGAPFAWPMVGNTNDTMGGNVIKVPMPFAQSMHITTSANPHFYHVVYRQYPPGTQVTTFDPTDKGEDVLAAFRTFGVQDPKAVKAQPGQHVGKTLSVDAGGSESVDLGQSCGIVSQLAIRVPSIPSTAYIQDDGRAFGSGGGSSFNMVLDANAKQCRLTRRIDATVGNQNISVTIDGQSAGTLSGGAAAASTFRDQSLDLAPELTAGKTSIKVATTFVSSDLDCNEFQYALHCVSNDGSWKSAGYVPSTEFVVMDFLDVGPNNPHDEAAHGYTINGATWEGLRMFNYNDQDHSTKGLPDVSISMSFDGKETVSKVPLGAFFGTALAKSNVRSLLLNVDTLIENGAWTSYFPMPFSGSASVSINNGGSAALNVSIDAVVAPCAGAAPSANPWGHFSAQHNAGATVPGVYWSFLSSTGPGVAYGVTHTFRGAIVQPANTLEFLEGDELVWLNTTKPGKFEDAVMHGTGTEDFYESGWYFQDFNTPNAPSQVPYNMPLAGMTTSVYNAPDLPCTGSCLSAYRLMIADSMPFGPDGISFNIEHGPDGNNIQADYETVAFYYA